MALGASLARVLVPGLVIYLQGDLGAGKTTLTRSLLHAAGYEGHVKSPTYTLLEPYEVEIAGQKVYLFHFDLYRMKTPEEFLDAGFREYFDGDGICIVEWPENGDLVLPPPDIDATLTAEGEGRKIRLVGLTDKGVACLQQLDFIPNL